MTVSYDFYTSSSYGVNSDGSGVTWGVCPKTGGAELWYGPPEYWGEPYQPITTGIPVIRRKPKKDRWDKYVESMKKIKKIKEITEVVRHIEVRPVIICGWCGARIPRGMEDEPCEYCGS